MRVRQKLKDRYRAILAYTGSLLVLGAALMLLPLLAVLAWPAERALLSAFGVPAAVMLVTGLGLWRGLRPSHPVALTVHEGGIIVVLSWIAVCLFSAWPLARAGGLNATQAVFEAVSGWSTTGLSVIDVTAASHMVLLWRNLMQLAGGAGLAIIMLASIAGPVGAGLSTAEGRADQLAPHVRESARLVLTMYAGYAAAGVAAYLIAGMGLFDALNHAFAAVSTGGFSTHPDSIGYWDSPGIEVVTIVLMLAGSTNYLTALLLLRGRFRAVARNGEMRLLAVLAPACALVLLCTAGLATYETFGKSLRVSVFEAVSALTTTGFSTTTYGGWPPLAVLVIVASMLIGGGTCSTSGGLKQYRVYLLWRTMLWEIGRWFVPRTAVVPTYIWQGERKDFVSDARVRGVAAFVAVFLAAHVAGVAVLTAYGHDLGQAAFESASAVGTVGLSVGITGPDAPPAVLWTETALMFLGRLEFMVVIFGIGRVVRDLGLALRREHR